MHWWCGAELIELSGRWRSVELSRGTAELAWSGAELRGACAELIPWGCAELTGLAWKGRWYHGLTAELIGLSRGSVELTRLGRRTAELTRLSWWSAELAWLGRRTAELTRYRLILLGWRRELLGLRRVELILMGRWRKWLILLGWRRYWLTLLGRWSEWLSRGRVELTLWGW